jgi:hypothetical protein
MPRSMPPDGTRLRAQFGVTVAALLDPGATAFLALAVCLAVAAATAFSVHLAIAILILGLSVIFAGRDRRHLDALILPPSLVGGFMAISGGAIGAALLSADGGFELSTPLLLLQVFFAYSLICFGLVTIVFLRDVPGISIPTGDPRFRRDCLRPLAVVAWMMIASQGAFLVTGLITGRLDRGQFGAEAAERMYLGITLTDVVPRFMDAGFLLAPAAWLVHRRSGRIALGCALAALLGLSLITGSRGYVVRPSLNLIVGCYLFVPLRPRVLGLTSLAAALALLVVVPAMLRFRDSPEFFDTPAWDVQARASVFLSGLAQSPSGPDGGSASAAWAAGTQLIGVSDLLVYEDTPSRIPFAGTSGLDHALTAWIPQYFMPTRPPLMDGNEIVAEYRGEIGSRTFATISLEADLFRRWGLPGVLLGVPVSALVSAIFIRASLRTLIFRDAVVGYLLLVILVSMFLWTPWSTVSWSLQRWAYDVPKHVVFALAIAAIARRLCGARPCGGLGSFGQPGPK